MKTKTAKKFTLNRETVSNLSDVKMNELKGGTATGITCVLCDTNMSCFKNKCLWEYTCQPTCIGDSRDCWM